MGREKKLNGLIQELETDSKNYNIRDLHRGINEFQKGYQTRNYLVTDENNDHLANSHMPQYFE
jgi:hypothetical protein